MAHSTRILPILGALVLATTLVAGAYVLSGPVPFIDRVTAQSSEELLREYAVKDTDLDGLTDWQESLYGTDPENPNSFRADLSDGEAVAQGLLTPESRVPEAADTDFPGSDPAPASLTERFSQEFLARYLSTRGNTPPSQGDLIRFVTDAVDDLATGEMAMDSYAARDMRVLDGSLEDYAAAMQAHFDAHEPPTAKNELEYMRDAVNNGDTEALERLAEIGAAYSALADDLRAASVPPEVLSAHVSIVNAVYHRGIALSHVAKLSQDPILAMLGIGEYTRSAEEYRIGFTAASEAFSRSGTVIREPALGHDFYATSIRAAATPAL